MKKLVRSLGEARLELERVHAAGQTVGSVHTLGALHQGHAEVVRLAAQENDVAVVTVYPNEAQLSAQNQYPYDPVADAELAFDAGASIVIAPERGSMYPSGYATFLDLGAVHNQLDETVVPRLYRGMVTMCVRWICFVRPTRTYWGEKDIGQLLLVQQAIRDLLIQTDVRPVPCVRYRSGIPISSRLMPLSIDKLSEVKSVYTALEVARRLIAEGERDACNVVDAMKAALRLDTFSLCYAKVVDTTMFLDLTQISNSPLILHIAIGDGNIFHFDGFLLRNERDVREGPAALWLDHDLPRKAP